MNEQGQTLWLEEFNPQIRVLDRLVQFLAAPSPGYVDDGARDFAFGDFMATPVWAEIEREARGSRRAANATPSQQAAV